MIRCAKRADLEIVKTITYSTIEEIYPHYYPKGAVDFFLSHHKEENVAKDIDSGIVFLAEAEGTPVGTVTIKRAEICRLFVLPQYQKKGIGKELMEFSEQRIGEQFGKICLDASFPAKEIYLKRGYQVIGYHCLSTENGDCLCYDDMEKVVSRDLFSGQNNQEDRSILNTSAFQAQEYDEKISKTLPFYMEMQQQAADLVNVLGRENICWLDTGCGTGNMAKMAVSRCSVADITLADPSGEMLELAKKRVKNVTIPVRFLPTGTEGIQNLNEFDVITAIQAHHYLNRERRVEAVERCIRALKPGGVYITFENIMPDTKTGIQLAQNRWKKFQIQNGKSCEEAERHIERFGKCYFPITVAEHLSLLKESGFRTVELFWFSYLQAGFYGIK